MGPSWPGWFPAHTSWSGKTGTDLFDIVLEPEKAGSKADWRPVGQGTVNKTGLVDLDKILAGDERVAYLKTQITSERDQEPGSKSAATTA